jgi:multiple sugar transport system permease protein
MIPPQARMIPIFLELRFFPLAGGNDILGRGGTGLVNTFFGLILPMIAGSFGVFLFRQFFLNFPQALDDAAKIDGLNEFKTYLNIYMPLSRPVIASLVAIKSAYTWNQYIWPLILTKGDKLRTVQLALTLFKDEDIVEWNLLMSATTTILIPMIILFFLAQKFFVKGIVTSGIKG